MQRYGHEKERKLVEGEQAHTLHTNYNSKFRHTNISTHRHAHHTRMRQMRARARTLNFDCHFVNMYINSDL